MGTFDPDPNFWVFFSIFFYLKRNLRFIYNYGFNNKRKSSSQITKSLIEFSLVYSISLKMKIHQKCIENNNNLLLFSIYM